MRQQLTQLKDVSQGQIREPQNIYSEWKAFFEIANLLGIKSELEMILKES